MCAVVGSGAGEFGFVDRLVCPLKMLISRWRVCLESRGFESGVVVGLVGAGGVAVTVASFEVVGMVGISRDQQK